MTTCLYCNAELLDGTTICPRCGEGSPATANQPTAVAETPDDPRPANRRLGLLVLAVMTLMASIGLAFALHTTASRRANDNRNQDHTLPPGPIMSDPAEFAGLGYIPSDVHVLAGIDLPRLRQSPAGEALASRVPVGNAAMISNVDHVLVGANIRAFPPKWTAVLHAPTDLDGVRLRGQLKSPTGQERGKWNISQSSLLRGFGLQCWIAEADPRTLIVAQLPSDFDAIPVTPLRGPQRFQHIGALLADRLPRNSAAWLVAQVEPNKNAIPAMLALTAMPAGDRTAWQNLQAVVLSIRPLGGDLDASLDIRGSDAAATQALAEIIERNLGSAGVVVARKADGDWQRLTIRLNADAIARLLPQPR